MKCHLRLEDTHFSELTINKYIIGLLIGVMCTWILMPMTAQAASMAYLEKNSLFFAEMIDKKYGDIVDMASLLHDYDRNLILAIIVVESEGKATAMSHIGAKGLMQLMPKTAKAMGAKDVNDPLQNILAGTRYLKELERTYGFDSREEAILAYNMGPSRAKRWLSQYAPEDFRYVRNVMYVYDLLNKEIKNNQIADDSSKLGDVAINDAQPITLKPKPVSSETVKMMLPVVRRDVVEEIN